MLVYFEPFRKVANFISKEFASNGSKCFPYSVMSKFFSYRLDSFSEGIGVQKANSRKRFLP